MNLKSKLNQLFSNPVLFVVLYFICWINSACANEYTVEQDFYTVHQEPTGCYFPMVAKDGYKLVGDVYGSSEFKMVLQPPTFPGCSVGNMELFMDGYSTCSTFNESNPYRSSVNSLTIYFQTFNQTLLFDVSYQALSTCDQNLNILSCCPEYQRIPIFQAPPNYMYEANTYMTFLFVVNQGVFSISAVKLHMSYTCPVVTTSVPPMPNTTTSSGGMETSGVTPIPASSSSSSASSGSVSWSTTSTWISSSTSGQTHHNSEESSHFGFELAGGMLLGVIGFMSVCVVFCACSTILVLAAQSHSFLAFWAILRDTGGDEEFNGSPNYLYNDEGTAEDGAADALPSERMGLIRAKESTPSLDSPQSTIMMTQSGNVMPWHVRYEDLEFLHPPLGQGAFGTVFKARYQGTSFAVKVFNEDSTSTGSAERSDYAHELSILSSLRHPNIVLFIGGCTTPKLCIVTELVARGSLWDVIEAVRRSKRQFPLRRVLSILKEICQGMAYLHSRNIVHRDLKSPNILLTEHWQVKIADFGLSRPVSTVMSCAGSLRWLAPEVATTSVPGTLKVDVYSFGLILYEMLMLDIPFGEQVEDMVVIRRLMAGDVPQLSPDLPIPPSLFELYAICTSLDPAERPMFVDIIPMIELIPATA